MNGSTYRNSSMAYACEVSQVVCAVICAVVVGKVGCKVLLLVAASSGLHTCKIL